MFILLAKGWVNPIFIRLVRFRVCFRNICSMKKARKALQYLASFTGDIPVQKYNSPVSPALEVCMSGGRLQLNSANVNYSYGPLHDAFSRYFRLDKPPLNPGDQVLILGFGGGSVAEILREELGYDNPITGIDADECVLDAAKRHFNIERLKDLTLVCSDALEFMEACRVQYQLIVVDIYVDKNVPGPFESAEFVRHLRRCLSDGGKVVFNKFAGTTTLEQQAGRLGRLFEQIFGNVRTFRIAVNRNAPNLMITSKG